MTWMLLEFPLCNSLSYPRIPKHFSNTSGCPRGGRLASPRSPRAVGTGGSQVCPWWWKRNEIWHGVTALALPTRNWSSQPGWLDTGTGVTSLPTPEGSGTPRALLGGALRSLTPMGITPQEEQPQVQTHPCSPSTAGFGVFPVGMICFNPGKQKFPGSEPAASGGPLLSPPGPGVRPGCARWCFSVKASLFGYVHKRLLLYRLARSGAADPP